MNMDPDGEEAKGTGELVRSLFLLLVLAGMGIGALLAMEIRGRERRAGLVADKHELETRLAFVEAKRGEMLEFLGRPQTELMKLTGVREWNGQAVTVAWDPVRRMAVVLMDRLPEPPGGGKYQLRVVSKAGVDGATVGEVDPGAPAQRVFRVPLGATEPVEFEIVLSDGKQGRTVFVPMRT